MARIIVADKKHNCQHLLGKFLDESHYDYLVALEGNITDDEIDVYMPANCDLSTQVECVSQCNECDKGSDELRIAFKFRRNFFSQEDHDNAYEGLRDAAIMTSNRGIAAGSVAEYLDSVTDGEEAEAAIKRMVTQRQHVIMDFFLNLPTESALVESEPFDIEAELDALLALDHRHDSDRFNTWVLSTLPENFSFDNWMHETKKLPFEEIKKKTKELQDKHISKTMYAISVSSGVAGWYDRYPRIPYGRETAYTKNNPEKFAMAYPFLQSLNKGFKSLLPWRWGNQKAAADKIDQKFLVPETVFTTVTVNSSFRTAAHFDAGDLDSGLSNLLVLSKDDNYSGGYLVFPEYRIAVSVRPRDLLLVNNHQVLHGNTPIIKHDTNAERVSIICYFRENMLQLGEYDYEQYRYEFVESSRLNKDHPLWHTGWNGINPNCFIDSRPKDASVCEEAREWYEFLKKHPKGETWVEKYHPWFNEHFGRITLEDFF